MRARIPQADRRRVLLGLLSAAAIVAAGCGGGKDSGSGGTTPQNDSQGGSYGHVHGLGINPGDGALYVATHYGLYRAAQGSQRVSQVGQSRQDVMGFTVVGPNRFLGSGHPGEGQNAPPNLGLISSTNGGVTWSPVSLSGEADFHVLRYSGGRVYGFDGSSGRLMVSRDRGRTWRQQSPPGGVIDLAPDPGNADHVIASTERGIAESKNAGKTWRILDAGQGGLLVWPSGREILLLDGDGQVQRSTDLGRAWQPVSTISGQPAAFASAGKDLYAARADATVVSSTDGGHSWQVRARP